MKVGDLVRRRATGQFFIYNGAGLWAGWGEFVNFDGRKTQLQMITVELI